MLEHVEKLGVERSWNKARNADLILFLVDAAAVDRAGGKLSAGEAAIAAELRSLSAPVIPIGTKLDLIKDTTGELLKRTTEAIAEAAGSTPLLISSTTSEGISGLTALLSERISNLAGGSGEVMVCNHRHFEALLAAKNSVGQALEGLKTGIAAELVSLDIRSGLSALNEIIGVTQTEDILGRIFSKFCIGK